MRFARLFAIIAITFVATSGQSSPVPARHQNSPSAQHAPSPTASAPLLKSNTRLVTVDVIVTDSHGTPVRGLTKDDFQITEERNNEQQIDHFEFVDRVANAATHVPHPPAPPYMFSNVLPQQLTIPPTVLLMDALNTDITNQAQVHQHMVLLLKTLPTDTPVAVFVLGHTLGMVQSFSTDPALLRAAVDKALHPTTIDQNPQDDPNSMSNLVLDANGGTETPDTQALEDFEAQSYEEEVSIRVDETTDAMVEIAKYLGGYAGRKNLVWFSESFPSWIAPSPDFGSNPFSGSAIYTDKINAAAEALTDAQVAVYPVDAKGLATDQIYSASQSPPSPRRATGPAFAGQLSRQSSQHQDALASMNAIAASTGGRTCENTNDLAGCVQRALNDGSSYYELGYYPQGTAWDGRFHKITVKTLQHGLKLTYRRGYVATDTQALLKRVPPDALLKQACNDPLPSTSISLTAEAISPQATTSQSPGSKYLLTISTSALSFGQTGESRQMNLRIAVCEFNPKGDAYQYTPKDLSYLVPEEIYRSWQTQGIRDVFDYDAKPDNKRLRFAVLDEPSGALGSVDVPAHPREFGSLPAPAPPPKPSEERKVAFMGSSGDSSTLDWGGDALSYRGNLSVESGAPAFVQKYVTPLFECRAGVLVPKNSSSSAPPPKLIFRFPGSEGHMAIVDLSGNEPQYSGDLPVDATAKPFFDLVLKLSHCPQP